MGEARGGGTSALEHAGGGDALHAAGGGHAEEAGERRVAASHRVAQLPRHQLGPRRRLPPQLKRVHAHAAPARSPAPSPAALPHEPARGRALHAARLAADRALLRGGRCAARRTAHRRLGAERLGRLRLGIRLGRLVQGAEGGDERRVEPTALAVLALAASDDLVEAGVDGQEEPLGPLHHLPACQAREAHAAWEECRRGRCARRAGRAGVRGARCEAHLPRDMQLCELQHASLRVQLRQQHALPETGGRGCWRSGKGARKGGMRTWPPRVSSAIGKKPRKQSSATKPGDKSRDQQNSPGIAERASSGA